MIKTFNRDVETVCGSALSGVESPSLRLNKLLIMPDKKDKLEQMTQICGCINTHGNKCLTGFKPLQKPSFSLKLMGRLLVNHSGGVLENAGLELHRNFGFPIIPGSALKGIARAACRNPEQANRLFGDEDTKKDDSAAGKVAFLFAYPAEKFEVVVDVLTAHGKNDITNPIPNFFPAVERGCKFNFMLRKLPNCSDADFAAAQQLLIKGLCDNGIGAKTAAGYGWFKATGEELNNFLPSDEQKTKAEEYVKQIGVLQLGNELDNILPKNEYYQRAYIHRMLKEKPDLLRKWRKKSNPKLEQLEELAKQLNEELNYEC